MTSRYVPRPPHDRFARSRRSQTRRATRARWRRIVSAAERDAARPHARTTPPARQTSSACPNTDAPVPAFRSPPTPSPIVPVPVPVPIRRAGPATTAWAAWCLSAASPRRSPSTSRASAWRTTARTPTSRSCQPARTRGARRVHTWTRSSTTSTRRWLAARSSRTPGTIRGRGEAARRGGGGTVRLSARRAPIRSPTSTPRAPRRTPTAASDSWTRPPRARARTRTAPEKGRGRTPADTPRTPRTRRTPASARTATGATAAGGATGLHPPRGGDTARTRAAGTTRAGEVGTSTITRSTISTGTTRRTRRGTTLTVTRGCGTDANANLPSRGSRTGGTGTRWAPRQWRRRCLPGRRRRGRSAATLG